MDHNTIEQCLERVPDSFTLVVLAAYRAQELSSGSKPCVNRGKNKDCVLSLREISSGCVSVDDLQEKVVRSLQQFSFLSE
jgi:DNA-directed RNA polymerase subunit omega